MKVLYLTESYIWQHKTDRGRRLMVEAVGRFAGVDLRVSGNGFLDWSEGLTVTANVHRWGWRPDVLWSYQPQKHEGVAEFDALRVQFFYDLYARSQRDELLAGAPHVVLLAQQADMNRWMTIACRRVHVGQFAEARIFGPGPERDVPCLVSGCTDRDVYPLRARWQQLVHEGRIAGKIRRHPGYRMGSLAKCLEQYRDYAADLGRSKLLLTGASKYRLWTQKTVEAALAGCLVISDFPNDAKYRAGLGRYHVRVPGGMSDSELVGLVQSLLASGEAADRAEGARRWALEHATVDRFAERFLEAVGATPP